MVSKSYEVKKEAFNEDDCEEDEAMIECDVKIKEEEILEFSDYFLNEADEPNFPSSGGNVQCEDCLAVFLSQNDYETHKCASTKEGNTTFIKAEAEDNKSLILHHHKVGLNRAGKSHITTIPFQKKSWNDP